ncbi:MAG: diguanylate cyclase [Bacillota bacterium]
MENSSKAQLARFEAAFQKYLDVYMTGRNLGKLEGMVSENFSGFGTGIDENFYSKAMGMGIFERDIKSAPNELHYNIHRHEINLTDQSNAIVVTELDLKTTIAEQEIKLNNLRMMMVMHEEDGIVKISGIHISFPTEVHAEGESYPLKELEERNMALKKMVDEKTKKQQEIIYQLQEAEEALRRSEQELKTVINNITDIVSKADVEGKFTYISESIYSVLGYKPVELLGKSILEQIHEDDLGTMGEIFQEGIIEGRKSARVEYRVRKKNGNYIWLETIGRLIFNDKGQPEGALFASRDISERKSAEEKIKYIGFHDQLTDLYNRHYFEKCKDEFKDIPVLSVIMTDLNGLKLVNDTYGHRAGDELLKKYADLLRKSFKQSDLFFRWGGDEFIVVLKNTNEAKSWELCNRLIEHCGETFVNEIPLSISVGISSKLPGGDIDEAIKEAEDMMYKNKLTESKSSKNLIMKTLLGTLSEKSFETKEHIERMGIVGRKIGERLSFSPSELSRLETLTMLHDIGKINLDSRILLKETALTEKEWEEIKKHPEVGYRITRTAEEFANVAEDILAHHERWDGKGYPQGLQGEDIPYLARLLNIIDSYDVMSNGRPYKKKMTTEEIIAKINRCSGKQFDPVLAEEFVLYLKEDCIRNGC